MKVELCQSVIVDDLLIVSLRDMEKAESLTRQAGVRLHYDISWSEMRYYKRSRCHQDTATLWEFSSEPFKEIR